MNNILEDCRTTLNRCITEEDIPELRNLCADLVSNIEKEQEKRLWIVTHTHRFGVDTFLVKSAHQPTIDEVVKAHSIDFETDRDDEWLEIDVINEVIDIF